MIGEWVDHSGLQERSLQWHAVDRCQMGYAIECRAAALLMNSQCRLAAIQRLGKEPDEGALRLAFPFSHCVYRWTDHEVFLDLEFADRDAAPVGERDRHRSGNTELGH